MGLRFYDTLGRQKTDFVPLNPERVRLYVCGPTVYDRAHIGNARPLIVFDVLFRLLRERFGAAHVTYVRNITDVDDKIITRAAERGIAIETLTETTTAEFLDDVAGLGCLPPTVEPRATAHIAEMIAIIEKLIASGHAYQAESHVLFDVAAMPTYGALSHRDLTGMQAGARVEVASYKRGDADFVLWKPAAATEPGWDSPWGRGRPGWHIECSAMSWRYLGETFDIHGGGLDLIFPHHENEIAQSCCAFGRDAMAQTWMHNGFLQVEGEKMSKSLGNFVTIRDLLTGDSFGGRAWPGEVLRLAMLRTHYRQPIDWTVRALVEAEQTLDRWYAAIGNEGADASPGKDVVSALADDLNTPAALAALHQLVSSGAHAEARASARLLGLLQETGSAWAARKQAGVDAAAIEARIAERLAARRAKDWAASDRIRDELARDGILLKDNKDGTTGWSLSRGHG
ncbi:cysteine--tRNA ligase [Lichenihabitans sp. Uapishka_5]|uniref:cysteine--tRNA ligase n=1 Tax=Lichenihabitans sp. Uapishka_5 TaxID=3037302 RepID=UPI0029E7E166|nr:cysteine--tRNA ligase [Lichenihabitans sp. Uapishka_5]MDX7949865.1 cysteine--tRNA ligase [Lichenihabitans sp. Uapishka_5]